VRHGQRCRPPDTLAGGGNQRQLARQSSAQGDAPSFELDFTKAGLKIGKTT
jgi:hypothetical protein